MFPIKLSQDLLPYCYRCSSTNPLVSNARGGDVCVNCGHPFIRSFATFDPLPLVQFAPGSIFALYFGSTSLVLLVTPFPIPRIRGVQRTVSPMTKPFV